MCVNEFCLNDSSYKFGFCKRCYFLKRKECLETNKCILCGRGLVPFKTRKDWSQRICHKKCWKEY